MSIFRVRTLALIICMMAAQAPAWAADNAPPSPSPSGSEAQTVVQLFLQLQTLRQEVRDLRGQNQVLEHQIQQLQNRQRRLYLDLDRRLQALEAGGNAQGAPAMPAAGGTLAPAATTAGAAATTLSTAPAVSSSSAGAGNGEALAAYQKAFNLLMNSHYREAIKAFEAFESRYPQSPYVANAEYWIGEAYYVEQMYDKALTHFQNVVNNYPQSNKVPAAMLKIGYCQAALKQWKAARQTLQNVVDQYPGTSAARLAMDRLSQLRSEGH